MKMVISRLSFAIFPQGKIASIEVTFFDQRGVKTMELVIPARLFKSQDSLKVGQELNFIPEEIVVY